MSNEKQKTVQQRGESQHRPLVAPCRQLDLQAPMRWIQSGIADYKQSFGLSLLYGVIMMLCSWLITAWGWYVGSFTLVIMLFAGFVFMGPALAIALYSVSYQLEQGKPVSMLFCLQQSRQRLGNQMVFAVALLIVFLVWARAATMVNIFIPIKVHPEVIEVLEFLVIGSAVGSVFAIVIFCSSAFALPMLMDREVDAITAMLSSFHAVLENKGPMLLWGLIILGMVLLGILTAFISFLVTLPIIGYATWHGYRETLITDAWPAAEHKA